MKIQSEYKLTRGSEEADMGSEQCNLPVIDCRSQQREFLKAFIRWNNKHNGIARSVPEKMADNYLKSL